MDLSTSINADTITAENFAVFLQKSRKYLALQDLLQSILKWHIWILLAYQDIKLRYRRSALGPFWITLSMAITVYSMGFLYAHLFRVNMQEYYPFLVAGMLGWSLISTVTNELTDTFVTADMLIKQIKLPYSLYIHRVATRNYMIFFHNLVVMIPILLIFHQHAKINFNTLLLIPNLLLIYVNAFSYGLILAMIGARYRDVPQIIKSLIQVAFFVTPVMWNPSVLPTKYQILMYLNPFYTFVELVRAPLIGMQNSPWIFVTASLITLFGISIALLMFTRYRARIIYWL